MKNNLRLDNSNLRLDLEGILASHVDNSAELAAEILSLIRLSSIELEENNAINAAHNLVRDARNSNLTTKIMSDAALALCLDRPTDEVKSLFRDDYDLTVSELAALVYVMSGKRLVLGSV